MQETSSKKINPIIFLRSLIMEKYFTNTTLFSKSLVTTLAINFKTLIRIKNASYKIVQTFI
jgi:hypothetical protein